MDLWKSQSSLKNNMLPVSVATSTIANGLKELA